MIAHAHDEEMRDADDPDADRWREDDAYEHTEADNPNAHMGRVFKVGDHVELGRALVADLGGARELVFDELHAWRYEAKSGLWSKIDTSEESRIVQSYSGTPKLPSFSPLKVKASDVSGAIKLAHDQLAQPGFFGAVNAIGFSDCVVRLGSDGLQVLTHDRQHRVRAGYPFRYEPKALPRRFLEFLSGLFRDDDDRADKEMFVQEFFGACVLGVAPRYQRACIGSGGGDNGKSTLADAMLACMPEGTTSAIAPQEWGQEYRRAMFVGKLLNAVGELPEREIIASESFKAIVTGDPIVGRVIRESPVLFRPTAGHFFAANIVIEGTDEDEPFYTAIGRTLRSTDAIRNKYTLEIVHTDDENEAIATARVVAHFEGDKRKPAGLSTTARKLVAAMKKHGAPMTSNKLGTLTNTNGKVRTRALDELRERRLVTVLEGKWSLTKEGKWQETVAKMKANRGPDDLDVVEEECEPHDEDREPDFEEGDQDAGAIF